MADENFVLCLFVKGKECSCTNRAETKKIVTDELEKKKKSRATFAALWRTEPSVGAFAMMMRRARPNAYMHCNNKPKQ
jgi:hypothetical protein